MYGCRTPACRPHPPVARVVVRAHAEAVAQRARDDVVAEVRAAAAAAVAHARLPQQPLQHLPRHACMAASERAASLPFGRLSTGRTAWYGGWQAWR